MHVAYSIRMREHMPYDWSNLNFRFRTNIVRCHFTISCVNIFHFVNSDAKPVSCNLSLDPSICIASYVDAPQGRWVVSADSIVINSFWSAWYSSLCQKPTNIITFSAARSFASRYDRNIYVYTSGARFRLTVNDRCYKTTILRHSVPDKYRHNEITIEWWNFFCRPYYCLPFVLILREIR